MKTDLPGKRISIALSLSAPTDPKYFDQNPPIPKLIWEKADAIHLMTYDEGSWPNSHSNTVKSKDAIDAWAIWGTIGGRNLDKKKLFLGCTFYGWDPVVGTSNGGIRVPYSTYSAAGFSGNRGDLPTDVQAKANHSLAEGYGGVVIWELGYDANTSTTPTLLNAIWSVIGPTIPPSITGPAEVCYYSSTFTLNNPPPGTITWSVSDPFTISSASGNQVVVTKISTSNAGGTLTAMVDDSEVATISIESCQTEISGPEELTSGQIGEYEMPYIPNATYSWWNYYGTLILSSGGPGATGEAPYGLYGIDYEIIYCSVTLNGIVSYFSKYVTIYGGMSPFNAYPNPASNLLNIEIDASAVATQRSAVGLQSDPTYDIRLYDGLGNIVRQQRTKSSTVQFNVTNLQGGTYYLHIYDGVSNKPKMMQIIVQH